MLPVSMFWSTSHVLLEHHPKAVLSTKFIHTFPLICAQKEKNMKRKKYLCISLALANTRVTFLFYLSIQLALDLQTITDVYDGVPPASGRGGEQMGSVRKCLSNHTTPLC